jgi:hypothetical protein
MDPDVCLAECRRLAAELIAIPVGVETGTLILARVAERAVQLAERFRALDEWIVKGGFVPRPWQDGRP